MEQTTLPDAELILAHLDELPTLPAVVVKLLRLTADIESRLDEVCRALRTDQSLAAKVLALANSASNGIRGDIATIERAVTMLGFTTVRNVVLTAKVFEVFGPASGAGFDRAEFWKHTVAVASAAQRLAARLGRSGLEPSEVFVSGLLHDLGKVALDAVYPKAYARIAAIADETHADIADVEREVLGVDHTIAGRHLAERWGLPRHLQEVVWLHHLAAETLPSSVSGGGHIAIVQLADTFVREQRLGYSGNHVFFESAVQQAERLGLPAIALDELAAPLVNDVAAWATLLGLDSDTAETVYLQALGRANAELGRLYSDLASSNSRLAAAARYFHAITELGRRLTPRSELNEVVRAIAEASVPACQRAALGAFGMREHPALVDVCWVAPAPQRTQLQTFGVPPDLAEWLADPGDALQTVLTRAPRVVRNLFGPALPHLGTGDPWLLPITHAGRIVGGVFFMSAEDERARLAPEAGELRSFLSGLGLALGQANAQAAAQRLSDELAENNRRLQQMQHEVLRTRTLASIAEMAAGAGHELNSPLAVISGRAQLLLRQTETPEARRALELVVEKAHECSQIVKQLLDFAKPRPLALASVDLATLLREECEAWLRTSEFPRPRFALLTGEALPPLALDRAMFVEALRELLKNAAEATARNDGPVQASARRGVSPEFIELLVRDRGCGMTAQVLRRAFDPFFSSRPAGRGRGLGLARAYRIIDSHGGRIWLESQPEQGTTAHVLLPVSGRGETGGATPTTTPDGTPSAKS